MWQAMQARKYAFTYSAVTEPEPGTSMARWADFWWDRRLSIFFPILPFPFGDNLRGCTSDQSGEVEWPPKGILRKSKEILFGGNVMVGAGLFPGEIEPRTCCAATVKLPGESCRAVDGSDAPEWPKSTFTTSPCPSLLLCRDPLKQDRWSDKWKIQHAPDPCDGLEYGVWSCDFRKMLLYARGYVVAYSYLLCTFAKAQCHLW